jgi:TetR/AcrR family transcriptional regulator, ethionamide resistance regulator
MARRGARKGGRPVADEQRDVERAILDATERLLAERRLDELSVADILTAANVSRASFYFYFESKYAVLADLLRRAVAEGHEAAQPWLGHTGERPPAEEIRSGILDGARLWRARAPLLRAIVESWRSDPGLSELWTELMDGYTKSTADRIRRDRASGLAPETSVDAYTLAATLTWLGERVYYLAAIGQPPFDDQDRLVGALTEIWLAAVYNGPPPDSPLRRST